MPLPATGIACGDPLIADCLARVLGDLGAGLVYDAPLGALLAGRIRDRVVVTPATGPLYLADLLEGRPRALIAGCRDLDTLIHRLAGLRGGDLSAPVYIGPELGRLPLTRAERRLLRAYLVRGGLEPAARGLGLSRKTAANRLSGIREKLGVRDPLALFQVYLMGPAAGFGWGP